MSISTIPQQAIETLSDAESRLATLPSVVGFDGFVDTILHVVEKRMSVSEYTRMTAMETFGSRITAAAGFSANFEFVTQMLKLGGNGPIMANALLNAGLPLTYIGCLGKPAVHPVFDDFTKKAKVISIAEPGYTDAIEFEDGKLMCGKHDSLKQVNWKNLKAHLPLENMVKEFENARLLALVNWTMLPAMGEIFKNILEKIAPQLTGEKRWVFFDLADPAKRTPEDIATALGQISSFEQYFRVILGLNFQESVQIGEVLGLPVPEQSHHAVADHAAAIREKLGIHTLVIHPTRFAAAADASGSFAIEGPYTEKPKITTGAGDHFNAGFCVGRLLGGDLPVSLQIGVATSGFYVREVHSPSAADLRGFLKTL